MSEIKPRREFDEPLRPEEGPTLRATQAFDEAQAFVPAVEDETLAADAPERVVENALKPRRSLWRRMVVAGLGLFGVSVVAQGVQWAANAWYTRDWIALGGCGRRRADCGGRRPARSRANGGGCIACANGQKNAMRRASCWRATVGGKARAFCEKLASQAGLTQGHPALARWHAAIHETHSDREVVTLYAHIVQPVLDSQARSAISRSAAESTLMIAVSPLALVDMAFIAWRNLRLVNRIATIYGIELGYYSRIRLFRLVLLNMAFAGASEMVREVGLDWMSQDLAARVSARVAQGLGAGLLTARLGVKAMELCRPLPWTEDDKPRLGDFRRQLLSEVKVTLLKQKREE